MYWQWHGWWVPHFETGGELKRKPAPRWWHLVGGKLRWKLREPAPATSSLMIIYKGEKWECHHHGREWVMSQYYDGMHSPQRSMATGRIWSEIFLMIQTIFMNQVLSHIMAWNETMGDRGAVTLRWSMVGWTGLITSRDVLLQTCDNFNLHCYSFNFSTCYDDLKLCKVTQLKPSFPFWQQSYLMEETRFWQVYRKIFFMPWLRETNYGYSLSVMGCLIRNRLGVWEETTGIWARHGGSNRKKWAPQKGNVPLRW